jgi:hypothetical protein
MLDKNSSLSPRRPVALTPPRPSPRRPDARTQNNNTNANANLLQSYKIYRQPLPCSSGTASVET